MTDGGYTLEEVRLMHGIVDREPTPAEQAYQIMLEDAESRIAALEAQRDMLLSHLDRDHDPTVIPPGGCEVCDLMRAISALTPPSSDGGGS